MKWNRLGFVLFVAAFLNAAANDFSGTWKAVFTGPMGQRPKMVSEMVFNLKVDGNKVTGMAHTTPVLATSLEANPVLVCGESQPTAVSVGRPASGRRLRRNFDFDVKI